MHDNISYTFSSAFTMSTDGMRAHIIPEDSDDELIEERWYTPPHMKEPEPTIKGFVSVAIPNPQRKPNTL
jgi:hypothetical protein